MRTELQRIITNLEVNPIPGRRQLTARILDQLHELQRLKRTAPVVEDKLKCPKCSSEDILTGDPDWAKEFPEVECNSCGECWTPRSALRTRSMKTPQERNRHRRVGAGITVLALYLMASLVHWDFNPGEWWMLTRIGVAGISAWILLIVLLGEE